MIPSTRPNDDRSRISESSRAGRAQRIAATQPVSLVWLGLGAVEAA
jgi:hypothetical protein